MGGLISILVLFALFGNTDSATSTKAEERAVRYLAREVPNWFKGNGCYSCHNNGDAARALFAAARKGHGIHASALTNTLAWLSRPEKWDQNKGDPAFSDKTLADIQFAAATESATKRGFLSEKAVLRAAANRLVRIQTADGGWTVETGAQPGSPTTYGSILATYLAWRTLKTAKLTGGSEKSAAAWLRRVNPRNTVDQAVRVLFTDDVGSPNPRALNALLAAQTASGGWGPFRDSPPEVFDTSLALLALARAKNHAGVTKSIRQGRAFLEKEQNADGSWPETTRPAGGESYAQRISTTGWALLALLDTRPIRSQRTRNGTRMVSEVRRS